jgi:hypothetical protein
MLGDHLVRAHGNLPVLKLPGAVGARPPFGVLGAGFGPYQARARHRPERGGAPRHEGALPNRVGQLDPPTLSDHMNRRQGCMNS